jgi:beta-N-acetylglucosaminidase
MVFKKPTDEYQWVFFMRLTQDECIMIEINSQTLNKGKNILEGNVDVIKQEKKQKGC